MSVTAVEIVNVAHMLQQQAEEALQRACIGRAYYGAFHASRIWHAKLPVPGRVGDANGSHEQLINQLRHPDRSTAKADLVTSQKLASNLGIMKSQRHRADYCLEDSFDPAEVLMQVALADRVLALAA